MEEYRGIFFIYRELNPYNNFNTKRVNPMPETQNLYFNKQIRDWLNKRNAQETRIEPIEQEQEFHDFKIIPKTSYGIPGLS